MEQRGWVLAAVAGAAAVVAYFAAPPVLHDPLWALFPLTGALAAVVAVRLHRPAEPGPLWTVAAAMTAIGAGDVLLAVGGSVDLASLGFLTGYVLLGVTAQWIARMRLPGGDRAGAIDSLIVMVAIAAVLWDVIAAPALGQTTTRSQLVALVGFPILGASVTASMVRVFFSGAARLVTAWAFLLASTGTLAANVVMLSGGGDLSDPRARVLWACSYVTVCVGVLHPDMRRITAPVGVVPTGVSVVRLATLGVALLAIPAVPLRTWDLAEQGVPVAILASCLCVGLVIWRIGLLLADREGSLQQLRASWDELARHSRRESALARLSEGAVGSWSLAEVVARTEGAVASVVDGVAVQVHLGPRRPEGEDPAVRLFPAATARGTHGFLSVRSDGDRRLDAGEVAFVQAAVNVLASAVHRRQAEAQARHRALHDALTGLPNRALLLERLEAALAGPDGLAVLFIDLDGFKRLNDSLGHAAGDEALVAVAGRLAGCVREGDTVARLAGDEFVALCPGLGRDEALRVADRVVAAVAEPLRVAGRTAAVGASVGVAVPAGRTGAEALLQTADAAMYRAKRGGGGAVALADGARTAGPTAA